jgi:cellulose synthase (UDP-forming)
VLAYGIAPQTVKAFLLQRLRWAQGTMQLYRSKESPVWIKGLSFKQRISYLSSFLSYFEAYQKLFFIITPSIIILFNVFPMDIDVLSFLVRWIPYFLLTMLANYLGGRGYFKYFLTERFNMLKMLIFIQSSFTLLQDRPLFFKVTPKSVNRSVYTDERRRMVSFMILFGLILGVVLYGLWKILSFGHVLFGYFNYTIALAWSSYNAMLILVSLIGVFKKRHDRSEYRFPVHIPAKLVNRSPVQFVADIQIDDLSLRGARLVVDENIDFEICEFLLRFFTPDKQYIIVPIKEIHFQKGLRFGKKQLGISFGDISTTVRLRLLEFIFVNLPRKSFSRRSI